MEQAGAVLRAIGTIVRFIFRLFLYILWGISRIVEVILRELNAFLKRVLEGKHK